MQRPSSEEDQVDVVWAKEIKEKSKTGARLGLEPRTSWMDACTSDQWATMEVDKQSIYTQHEPYPGASLTKLKTETAIACSEPWLLDRCGVNANIQGSEAFARRVEGDAVGARQLAGEGEADAGKDDGDELLCWETERA